MIFIFDIPNELEKFAKIGTENQQKRQIESCEFT